MISYKTSNISDQNNDYSETKSSNSTAPSVISGFEHPVAHVNFKDVAEQQGEDANGSESRVESGEERRRLIMRKASTHIQEFNEEGAAALFNTVKCCSFVFAITYLVVIACGLSIACIVIGVAYLNDCAGQPILPIILISTASVSLITSNSDIVTIIKKKRKKDEKPDVEEASPMTPEDDSLPFHFPRISITISSLRLLHLALFIYLCVLVFSIYPTVEYTKTSRSNEIYCSLVLYRFSFWYLIIQYIEIGIGIICCASCCCCCCCCCGGKCNKNILTGIAVEDNENRNRQNTPQNPLTVRKPHKNNTKHPHFQQHPTNSVRTTTTTTTKKKPKHIDQSSQGSQKSQTSQTSSEYSSIGF